MFALFFNLGLAACNQIGPSSPTAAPASSTGESGKEGSTDIDSAEAQVVPSNAADLAFKVIGRVQTMLVAEAQKVDANQELARLDTRALEQSAIEAEAGLRLAQAQLD